MDTGAIHLAWQIRETLARCGNLYFRQSLPIVEGFTLPYVAFFRTTFLRNFCRYQSSRVKEDETGIIAETTTQQIRR